MWGSLFNQLGHFFEFWLRTCTVTGKARFCASVCSSGKGEGWTQCPGRLLPALTCFRPLVGEEGGGWTRLEEGDREPLWPWREGTQLHCLCLCLSAPKMLPANNSDSPFLESYRTPQTSLLEVLTHGSLGVAGALSLLFPA